jgi:hypothetical protein
MQDILSSVFGNEEALARYEVLFKDTEPISAADLLTLAIQVAGQFQSQYPVPATKER